jgi:hypothetical protein
MAWSGIEPVRLPQTGGGNASVLNDRDRINSIDSFRTNSIWASDRYLITAEGVYRLREACVGSESVTVSVCIYCNDIRNHYRSLTWSLIPDFDNLLSGRHVSFLFRFTKVDNMFVSCSLTFPSVWSISVSACSSKIRISGQRWRNYTLDDVVNRPQRRTYHNYGHYPFSCLLFKNTMFRRLQSVSDFWWNELRSAPINVASLHLRTEVVFLNKR